MKAVTGIFDHAEGACRAAERLREMGLEGDRLNLLLPGTTAAQIEDLVPTQDGERSGVGAALGGVLGGATGLVVASAFIPGIGPFAALGLGAAQLIVGLGSAIGGAALGSAIENAGTSGVPHDDLIIYEDAVRQGRSVVIALTNDSKQAAEIRELFRGTGAESLDAARHKWWVGLRDAEKQHYEGEGRGAAGTAGAGAAGGTFTEAEADYRKGFEAALLPAHRGWSFADVKEDLRKRYADKVEHDAFRRGYDRGHEYAQGLKERAAPKKPA